MKSISYEEIFMNISKTTNKIIQLITHDTKGYGVLIVSTKIFPLNKCYSPIQSDFTNMDILCTVHLYFFVFQIAHVIREIRLFQQTPYRIEHHPRVNI